MLIGQAIKGKSLKKYCILLCLVVLCGVVPAQAASSKKQPATVEFPSTIVNKIVAVVNGERITRFDVQRMAIPDLMRRRLDPGNPAHKEQIDQVLDAVLESQINDILLAQEALRLKMELPETEVDKEISQILKRSKMSPEDFEKQLQREGMDMKGMRDRIRKGLLRQRIVATMVARKIVVNKKDVAEYYAAHKDELREITQVRMAILVYPPNVNAESIAQRISSGKLSFEQAVRQHSIDPATNKKNGEMAPAEWKDMAPEWRERLSRMKNGDVSNIFAIDRFKAQVKLLEKVGADKERTLEEVTPEIENILREPLFKERYAEYTKGLRSRAIIDIKGL